MFTKNPRLRALVTSAAFALMVGTGLSVTPTTATASPAPAPAPAATSPSYKIASLNLHNQLGPRAVRHDIRTVIRNGASVIGMQERRGTRPMVKRALPDHWRLAMPTTADGTDDNPVAWNSRVWRAHRSWPRVLAKKTWWRDGYGKMAIHQYAVVVVLEHRTSGHRIRVASFHMPSRIQRRDGGPNWKQRDRVEASWRMSRNLRNLASNTPAGQQFTATCDCNVSHGRDWSKHLTKGKITRPIPMMNQYTEVGKKTGWQIDYVMTRRKRPYVITSWRVLHDLKTDHPSPIVRFTHR